MREVLAFVRAHPAPGSRAGARGAALAAGLSRRVAEWLASEVAPGGAPAPCWDCGGGGAGGSGGGGAPGDARAGGDYCARWRFCPSAAAALFESTLSHDSWPLLFEPPPGARVQLIAGSRSRRWAAAGNATRLLELQAAASVGARGVAGVARVPGGHWLHVEAPAAAANCVAALLR